MSKKSSIFTACCSCAIIFATYVVSADYLLSEGSERKLRQEAGKLGFVFINDQLVHILDLVSHMVSISAVVQKQA